MTIPGDIGITAQEAEDRLMDFMRNIRLQAEYADYYEPLRDLNNEELH